MSYKVLLVDDEEDVARSLAMALELKGHKVTVSLNSADAFLKFTSGPFDCLVADFKLGPQERGTDLLKKIREIDERIGAVLITGSPQELGDVPESLGVWSVLEKPFSNAVLVENVEAASELATISPEEEARITESCETTVHRMKDMRKDMADETGIFRALKQKK